MPDDLQIATELFESLRGRGLSNDEILLIAELLAVKCEHDDLAASHRQAREAALRVVEDAENKEDREHEHAN